MNASVLLPLSFIVLLISCTQPNTNSVKSSGDSAIKDSSLSSAQSLNHFETSTYDDSALTNVIKQREDLKRLSDKGVFRAIQNQVLPKLDSYFRNYFVVKADYELLTFAEGDLFGNKDKDYAFIVYDRH